MAIAQIAVSIFIFTLLFIFFAYSKSDYKIGIWIIVMLLFTIVLGFATSGTGYTKQRVHPSFLIAQYSRYNIPPSVS